MVKTLNQLTLWLFVVVVAFLLIVLAFGGRASAGCRQLVRSHAYHHVQQVAVVQPLVLYKAGADIEADALADKVVRLAQQKLAQTQPKLTAPAAGLLTQRCASCHDGNKAFSMAEGLTPLQKWRVVEIFSHKIDVPLGMEGIVAKAQTDGSLPDLLDATVAAPTLSEQPVAKPAPEPGELQ